jgi:hypothetical protein
MWDLLHVARGSVDSHCPNAPGIVQKAQDIDDAIATGTGVRSNDTRVVSTFRHGDGAVQRDANADAVVTIAIATLIAVLTFRSLGTIPVSVASVPVVRRPA